MNSHLPKKIMKYSPCGYKGCQRPRIAKGLCNAHYLRKCGYSDVDMDAPLKDFEVKFCIIEGCDHLCQAHGYCSSHNYRNKRYGDPLKSHYAPAGSGHITKSGYHSIQQGEKRAMVHRTVMEKMIGRPLLPGETVHHRNGIRSDNRPENLQLFASNHGGGQKISDLVDWAHEILNRYTSDGVIQPQYGAGPSA